MHSYHIFFQKGRGLDWSFICQNHGKISKNTSNCSFFSTSSPFLSSKSFFHYPLQVCDRFQTGWEGRTMCCDPQYRPQAQRLASTPSPSRPWGGRGWPPPLCPPPLSWSPPLLPPPPESIALWHHTNDPPKSMHHSTVHHQQWLAMWFRSEKEGARIRWKVLTGKYKIKGGKEKQERCGSKTRKMKKQTMCTYCS